MSLTSKHDICAVKTTGRTPPTAISYLFNHRLIPINIHALLIKRNRWR
ncbi:hypothetical protein N9L92_04930 [Saprospiraceae bacterium]|nr:hypothetical protein [Saprospiraceae bacterium]